MKLWIGATDAANEGTWTWSKGETFQYFNWESSCLNDMDDSGKNCAYIEDGKEGRWNDGDCSETLNFLCQKGSSSKPLWVPIHGAEYAYLYHKNCVKKYTGNEGGKKACEQIGGEAASILSQVVQDEVQATFNDLLTGNSNTRIGARDNNNEGTWKWTKGESFVYTNWKTDSGEPNNDDSKDCAYMDSTWKWVVSDCGDDNANAVLCMKGTSTSFDTTTQAPAASYGNIGSTQSSDKSFLFQLGITHNCNLEKNMMMMIRN